MLLRECTINFSRRNYVGNLRLCTYLTSNWKRMAGSQNTQYGVLTPSLLILVNYSCPAFPVLFKPFSDLLKNPYCHIRCLNKQVSFFVYTEREQFTEYFKLLTLRKGNRMNKNFQSTISEDGRKRREC